MCVNDRRTTVIRLKVDCALERGLCAVSMFCLQPLSFRLFSLESLDEVRIDRVGHILARLCRWLGRLLLNGRTMDILACGTESS